MSERLTAKQVTSALRNAMSLLCDNEGERWVEFSEIKDSASPDLIAARDVWMLVLENESQQSEIGKLRRRLAREQARKRSAQEEAGHAHS